MEHLLDALHNISADVRSEQRGNLNTDDQNKNLIVDLSFQRVLSNITAAIRELEILKKHLY
jgi:hypothetical protein